MDKKIAIMQPTFIPWVGYFGLLKSVDLFIFLDSVQFEKRSWQQRNIIRTSQGTQWLTVPVISKGKFDQKIIDTRIDKSSRFSQKAINTIRFNYSKTKYYCKYSNDIFKIINENDFSLSDLNINLIKYLSNIWEIDTSIKKSSNYKLNGKKDELLHNICQLFNANIYVSPKGSENYLTNSSFFTGSSNKIKLNYFEYIHPTWDQIHGDFIPYCSSLDLLFNMGPEGSNLIQMGIK